MNNDDLLAHVRREIRRRALVSPSATARRSALVRAPDWDSLRGEFLVVLEREFQPELQDLARFLRESPSEPAAVGVLALWWFAKRNLFAPWLLPVLEQEPPSFLRPEPGGRVRLWPALQRPKLEAEPPVESIAAPEPWTETEAAFKYRCQSAWDAQLRWAKKQGFTAPKQARARGADRGQRYLAIVAARALRPKTTWEAHADQLGLSDHKTLASRVGELRERLLLGGRREAREYLRQQAGGA
jgi:hypothetical protein